VLYGFMPVLTWATSNSDGFGELH